MEMSEDPLTSFFYHYGFALGAFTLSHSTSPIFVMGFGLALNQDLLISAS
jgi:hypothetical protein